MSISPVQIRNKYEQTLEGGFVDRPAASFSAQDEDATSGRPCDAFDAGGGEKVILRFYLDTRYRGTGTLKLDVTGAANTTTNTDTIALSAKCLKRRAGADQTTDNTYGTADTGSIALSSGTAYQMEKATIALSNAPTVQAGDELEIEFEVPTSGTTITGGADALVGPYRLYEAFP